MNQIVSARPRVPEGRGGESRADVRKYTEILILHRLAALYLRLRKKRPPLIDMIEAWSSARWDPRCYRPERKRRAG